MTDLIDIDLLARVKGIPVEVLTGFGLRDLPDGGVRIDYVTPGGLPARARHRWQITGLTGSTFEVSDRPITAYWRPENKDFAGRRGTVLLAEGESTCWTLWYQGFAAAGFPGAEQVDCLELGHLAPASTAVIIAEWDDPDTYPDGVEDFVDRVVRRLRICGYGGTVKVLNFAPVAEDVNALYQADPSSFESSLEGMIRAAPQL
ncbi:MAG: hypothetical protein ACRDRX_19430 [Pseudonocardiaceae bacterium]